ncbi:MAG TPA: hypothetical protein VHX38_20685 [Pseudonocardiaceae bacterium]|nr:hypothetical protein [Pseudonocardiaceae bacterium]
MTSHVQRDLPGDAWHAVVERCGEVSRVEHAPAGINADFAASLDTDTGPVFVKGVRLDSRKASAHRTEARVNGYLPATLAPRLLWEAEAAGWLLLGFEHVSGRHADIGPGSPDLPLILAAVTELQGALTPCPPVEVGSFADQWERLAAWRLLLNEIPAELDSWTRDLLVYSVENEPAAIEAMRGDSLTHTDVQPLNILIDGDHARLIDWAWSRRAAPWVDAAFLVIRLIGAGHSPVDAERWAARTPAWQAMPEQARTLFAVEVLGVWEWLLHNRPMPHRAALTDAARLWAKHRLDRDFPDRIAQ